MKHNNAYVLHALLQIVKFYSFLLCPPDYFTLLLFCFVSLCTDMISDHYHGFMASTLIDDSFKEYKMKNPWQ